MPTDFSTYTDPPYPRGIVNNNPGNLRIGIPWQGLKLGIPGGFAAFVSVEYGVRAMAKDLYNKIVNDGLNTIALEVSKYAPPSENNTSAYIQAVANSTGWDPDAPIDLSVPGNLQALVRAHIMHENGDHYGAMVTDQMIADGVSMMGQTILEQTGNFFVTNPELSAAFGLGIVAVALVILGIIQKRINLLFIKKLLK